jgi:hypothetical protein
MAEIQFSRISTQLLALVAEPEVVPEIHPQVHIRPDSQEVPAAAAEHIVVSVDLPQELD